MGDQADSKVKSTMSSSCDRAGARTETDLVFEETEMMDKWTSVLTIVLGTCQLVVLMLTI
jgi:hypothetical protein